MKNHGYHISIVHRCIDAYVTPIDITSWMACPHCRLQPKVWAFDNGRSTACGCGNNDYDHFSVRAESIMSMFCRDAPIQNTNNDQLRLNWNEYCSTSINVCSQGDLQLEDKW